MVGERCGGGGGRGGPGGLEKGGGWVVVRRWSIERAGARCLARSVPGNPT